MQYESEQLTFDHEKLTPRGIYSFLRGIDTSVREVRDAQYDQERNTTSLSRVKSLPARMESEKRPSKGGEKDGRYNDDEMPLLW